MKYRDLFHYDPIEAIVQLRHANERAAAQSLVESYVVSDEMAQRLAEVVIPQLQFARPEDNKGVLIVGNYGSGKSHLLSVLSAVAEHPDMAGRLRNPKLADAARQIAGRFKVLRLEIGHTAMSLRDIVCTHLEEFLQREGVTYRFPALTDASGHKRSFEDMMAAFAEKFPDQGLLLLVDEMLDFLRQRDDFGVRRDLAFLREVGESCRDLRLRFIAGLQETIFSAGRWEFAHEELRRVEARFQQVLIARSDIRFVVSARLLRKDPAQRDLARAHLQRFTRFYGRMAERLDLFVDTFPVHPDLLDVFDRMRQVETRTALTTLTRIVRPMLDDELPTDRPGVVSYDRFWESIAGNPVWRAEPDVGRVADCVQVLTDRVRAGILEPAEQRMALRMMHALGIQRLTVGDVETPVGLTVADLRDGLCLYDPGVEGLGDPAEDLATSVETVLTQVIRVVNGQFITRNPDSDQFYLDLKKTEDYDALIARKVETLSDEHRDRYWFEALKQVMECADTTLVSGFRMWEHELEWRERRASRRGYLFFGAPNQRSTAQPPRDFYLYFLQPWKPVRFTDEKRADELFFRLAERDPAMVQALERYAAAAELSLDASGNAKLTYEKKSREALHQVLQWLRERFATAFTVTHEGRSLTPAELLKKGKVPLPQTGRGANLREVVNGIASLQFAEHFAEQAREYPTFGTFITAENRGRMAADALKCLRGSMSRNGKVVLDALRLLDDEAVRPRESPYAQHVMAALAARPGASVLPRGELLGLREGVEYDTRFRLEPEWFVVVLAALVYAGEITLVIGTRKYDAADLDALVSTPVDDIRAFRHIERPRGWNRAMLAALCELVGVETGRAGDITEGRDADKAFQDLVAGARRLLDEPVTRVRKRVDEGVVFWGQPVVTDAARTEHLARLGELVEALQRILNLRKPADLKNLTWSEDDLRGFIAHKALARELDKLLRVLDAHGASATWMIAAEAAMAEDDPWVATLRDARRDVLARLADPKRRGVEGLDGELARTFDALRASYATRYTALHQHARLSHDEGTRRDRFLAGATVSRLDALGRLSIFSRQFSDARVKLLQQLPVCMPVSPSDLVQAPRCPRCGLRPVDVKNDPSVWLRDMQAQLETTLDEWASTLFVSLDAPGPRAARAALTPSQRGVLDVFLRGRPELPETLDDETLAVLNALLRGVRAVTVTPKDLMRALLPGRAAATADELRQNLERFLTVHRGPGDESMLRFLPEDEEKKA